MVLGTRSGIDWIIDRWNITTDKTSVIVNDVTQRALEQRELRYIIDLIERGSTDAVVTVASRRCDRGVFVETPL